jgi:hypothetical protein
MNIKTIVFWILFWTWCLPQAVLGAAWWAICKLRYKNIKTVMYRDVLMTLCPDFQAGLSLAPFTFVIDYNDPKDAFQDRMTNHEWGHTRQSLMLGPLYLLVVGIPSICWLYINTHWLTKLNYYTSMYTELWADKCGGVVRPASDG